MKSKKSARIETKSSRTAGFTCLSRAASYVDKRECYSGPDSIAYVLIPAFFKLLLKSRWLFRLFIQIFFNGMFPLFGWWLTGMTGIVMIDLVMFVLAILVFGLVNLNPCPGGGHW